MKKRVKKKRKHRIFRTSVLKKHSRKATNKDKKSKVRKMIRLAKAGKLGKRKKSHKKR